MKQFLLYVQRQGCLRLLSPAACRFPAVGSALRNFSHRIMLRGERVWVRVPGKATKGL